MKTTDFENFKVSLNLNIEIDASLRRITEKIKLISQTRDSALMERVIGCLHASDEGLERVIINHICKDDECTEE